MIHVVVLSDTHLHRGSRVRLPDRVYDELGRADAVLHAGDIVSVDLLRELEGFAPVYAVLGNNDAGLAGVIPERRLVELAGVRIGMVHDAGPSAGRENRVRRFFPDADVVVFGHSHVPVDAVGVDGQRLLNPGSPTQKRMQPHPTFATLDLSKGKVRGVEIVTL